jgi:hypothetical protein
MNGWSLSQLLSGLHDAIQDRLAISPQSFAHPGTKGDASEAEGKQGEALTLWAEIMGRYFPTS